MDKKDVIIIILVIIAVILLVFNISFMLKKPKMDILEKTGEIITSGGVKEVSCINEKRAISGGCVIEEGISLQGFGLKKSKESLEYYDTWYCDFKLEKTGAAHPYIVAVNCQ